MYKGICHVFECVVNQAQSEVAFQGGKIVQSLYTM